MKIKRYKTNVLLAGKVSMSEWNLLLRLIYGKEKYENWKGEVRTILDSIETKLEIVEKE